MSSCIIWSLSFALFKIGSLKAEIGDAVLYTLPGVINFYACWYFDDFWLFLSIWCNRCRKKFLEFVLGMLVTKAFPRLCCDVAAVSKRLLKHQKLSSF